LTGPADNNLALTAIIYKTLKTFLSFVRLQRGRTSDSEWLAQLMLEGSGQGIFL
jgi:hypothetical protein